MRTSGKRPNKYMQINSAQAMCILIPHTSQIVSTNMGKGCLLIHVKPVVKIPTGQLTIAPQPIYLNM
ncbi:hypothetical protein Pst134EB_012451 [Puccinia striiformis f. sp. tritici]|nr:hypothetical protein Pst134EB_012451 [Puccinia striiformis f. sp. tritici]